jgi:hypothetical protein
VLGRCFNADEDQLGNAHFAVLSYALWHSQFGGDPNIVKKTIQLDGEAFNIVGVLPRNFSLGGKQDLWVPLALNRAKPDDRGSHYLHVVVRLKPDVNPIQASAALTGFADDLRRAYPSYYAAGRRGRFRTVHRPHQGTASRRPSSGSVRPAGCRGVRAPDRLRKRRQPTARPRHFA